MGNQWQIVESRAHDTGTNVGRGLAGWIRGAAARESRQAETERLEQELSIANLRETGATERTGVEQAGALTRKGMDIETRKTEGEATRALTTSLAGTRERGEKRRFERAEKTAGQRHQERMELGRLNFLKSGAGTAQDEKESIREYQHKSQLLMRDMKNDIEQNLDNQFAFKAGEKGGGVWGFRDPMWKNKYDWVARGESSTSHLRNELDRLTTYNLVLKDPTLPKRNALARHALYFGKVVKEGQYQEFEGKAMPQAYEEPGELDRVKTTDDMKEFKKKFLMNLPTLIEQGMSGEEQLAYEKIFKDYDDRLKEEENAQLQKIRDANAGNIEMGPGMLTASVEGQKSGLQIASDARRESDEKRPLMIAERLIDKLKQEFRKYAAEALGPSPTRRGSATVPFGNRGEYETPEGGMAFPPEALGMLFGGEGGRGGGISGTDYDAGFRWPGTDRAGMVQSSGDIITR